MICTNCGAHLRDTDLFCPKCGCPVNGAGTDEVFSDKTLDIPIEAIERNIISETAAKVSVQERSAAKSAPPQKKTSAPAAPKKKESVSDAPKKKKVSYRKEEDWEEDDWDDEEESVDIITIMTVIVGCVLLVVVAVLGYHMYRQYSPRNYGDAAQKSEDRETDNTEQEMEEQQLLDEISDPISDHYVAVIKNANVNVRDNPSTTDSNVLKVAQKGDVYPYVGRTEDGEWIEILLDDNSVGYVFHEYVTVND